MQPEELEPTITLSSLLSRELFRVIVPIPMEASVKLISKYCLLLADPVDFTK